MSRLCPAIGSALTLSLLASCATPPAQPASCDGRHRRDANPSGSVLIDQLNPRSSAVDQPPPRGAVDQASFAHCRGTRP